MVTSVLCAVCFQWGLSGAPGNVSPHPGGLRDAVLRGEVPRAMGAVEAAGDPWLCAGSCWYFRRTGERGEGTWETGPAEASHQGSVHLRLRGRPRPSRALCGLCSICFSVSLSIYIMNCSVYRNQDLEQSRILTCLNDGKLWQREPPSPPGRPQLERSDSCPVPGPRKALGHSLHHSLLPPTSLLSLPGPRPGH